MSLPRFRKNSLVRINPNKRLPPEVLLLGDPYSVVFRVLSCGTSSFNPKLRVCYVEPMNVRGFPWKSIQETLLIPSPQPSRKSYEEIIQEIKNPPQRLVPPPKGNP